MTHETKKKRNVYENVILQFDKAADLMELQEQGYSYLSW